MSEAKTWYLLHNGTQYPIGDHGEAVQIQRAIDRERKSMIGAYVEFVPAGQTAAVRIEPLHEAAVIGL